MYFLWSMAFFDRFQELYMFKIVREYYIGAEDQ